MRDLARRRHRAGEDRRGVFEILHHRRHYSAVCAERDAAIGGGQAGRTAPQGRCLAIGGECGHLHRIAGERSGVEAVLEPEQRCVGRLRSLGDVDGRAPGEGNGVDIAADRAEIAHQAADIGNRLAVRRHAREIELRRRFGDLANRAGGRIDRVERCHPPIVVAIAQRGAGDKAMAIGCPIIFVDVATGGRHRFDGIGSARAGDIENGDAPLVIMLADLADLANAGLSGTGFLLRAERDEQGNALAIGGKARGRGDAGDRRHGVKIVAARRFERHALVAPRQEGEPTVAAERQIGIVAIGARIDRRDDPPIGCRTFDDRIMVAAATLDAGDDLAIGRQREIVIVMNRGGKRGRGGGYEKGGEEQAHRQGTSRQKGLDGRGHSTARPARNPVSAETSPRRSGAGARCGQRLGEAHQGAACLASCGRLMGARAAGA